MQGKSNILSNMHHMIGAFEKKLPKIAESAFVHLSAEIYGDVTIEDKAAVFHHCVMRGDINKIHVGACTNVQEHSILHVSDEFPCSLKEWVTVGHGAILHGATVEKGALIGIRSVVLDGAVIGEEAWVAAGAVVLPGTKIPPRGLAVGIPAKVVREVKQEEVLEMYRRARRYIEKLAPWYKQLQERGEKT